MGVVLQLEQVEFVRLLVLEGFVQVQVVWQLVVEGVVQVEVELVWRLVVEGVMQVQVVKHLVHPHNSWVWRSL